MTPEARRIRAADAQHLLDNKLFKEAFSSVEQYLIDKAHSTDTNDRERTANVVNCMQLLQAVKREIIRVVEDGEVAKIEIEQTEKRKLLRFIR